MATVFVTLKGFLPKRYNLEEGDICPVDIYASGVITDKLTTEKLRKDAQEYVQKQYRFDLEVSDQVEKNLEDTIDQIHTMREKYDSANEMSEGEISASSLSREDWEFLFSTGQSELERFENSCRQAMEDTMKNGLDASQPDEAFAFLSENLNKRNFSQSARRVAYSLIASLLKPNKTYDAEATEAARQEATSKVEAVVYQKGEKIIGRGERINEADYAMMKEMGYIKKTDLSNLVTYIGLVAVVLMLFVFCCFLLRRRYAEAVEPDHGGDDSIFVYAAGVALLYLEAGIPNKFDSGSDHGDHRSGYLSGKNGIFTAFSVLCRDGSCHAGRSGILFNLRYGRCDGNYAAAAGAQQD